MDGHWRGAAVVASLAAVILGINLYRPSEVRANANLPVAGQNIPIWATGIDKTSLGGWIRIQKKFSLRDSTIQSAIQLLRTNKKYLPGHIMYDLTKYPAEVERAFSLLASQRAAMPFGFGPLEEDLKGRVVAGARFPDEAPGGIYSSLQIESFNNIVVLSTIKRLHSHQDDPATKQIIAALLGE